MKNKMKTLMAIGAALLLGACSTQELVKNNVEDIKTLEVTESYYFPEEAEEHEATWLQWPQRANHGDTVLSKLEPIWIEMTAALTKGENVNIVAYSESEKERIAELLLQAQIDTSKVKFFIEKTEDIWARDTGPIFVKDKDGNDVILDFGFNHYGKGETETLADGLPTELAEQLGIEAIDLSGLVIEGGCMEFDGNGTFMGTRSSITNSNRNPNLTEAEIEDILRKVFGIKQFIWMDGVAGIDVTDYHIDGVAKFHNKDTIVTMSAEDLDYNYFPEKDIEILFNAKNADGVSYKIVELPLTKNNIKMPSGKDYGEKGMYINYYVGNSVVLVPFYNDPNDQVAADILQEVYPNREMVGIDVRDLQIYGGMIHCVTQQQPK